MSPASHGARILVLVCIGTGSVETRAGTSEENDWEDTAPPPPAIHATRLDYPELDSPEAVTVITAEDIRLAGYIEISEIFRSVPGFRVLKIGDDSRVSYHGTTAIQQRRLLVTIDGKNVLIGNGQYVEFDRLPIDSKTSRESLSPAAPTEPPGVTTPSWQASTSKPRVAIAPKALLFEPAAAPTTGRSSARHCTSNSANPASPSRSAQSKTAATTIRTFSELHGTTAKK